jgi:hypothetical protein
MTLLFRGLLMVSFMSAASAAKAIESGSYFRVWQGFAKVELTGAAFINEIPSFMKETVNLYRDRALNNYIVIIPPKEKPAFLPDEFALVSLNSKENYDAIRATPAGEAYSNRHWDLFNKETSKSAIFTDYQSVKPKSLIHNTAYDMIGRPINWAQGYNAVFIGIKKPTTSASDFLQQLKKHIESAQKMMSPRGLLGYIVIANENYEIAYLNWSSKQDHDLAVESVDGKFVFAEAGEIMNVLMYQEAQAFKAGDKVSNGSAYSTLQ